MTQGSELPSIDQLIAWGDEGLSAQEIASRIYEESGRRVSEATIAVVLRHTGQPRPKNRYEETIPWRVKTQHLKEYPARMLRLLGRRRAGLPLTENESTRLDNWLEKLERDHAVIGYAPGSAFGFHYIEKNDQTDGKDGIPIRRETIKLTI